MINPEYLTHTPEILLLIPLAMAFSSRVRDEIVGKAGNRSEISGKKAGKQALHAMHLNHKKDETYNTVERGMLVTPIEHVIYHVVHRGRAELIGLTEEENEQSITLLMSVINKLGE